MKATPCVIPDVMLLEPKVFGDDRGFFFESFNQARFEAAIGRSVTFVQDNHERGICRDEIVTAIMKGEVIETYPTDRPYPSCLILYAGADPVHVVAAADPAARSRHGGGLVHRTKQSLLKDIELMLF